MADDLESEHARNVTLARAWLGGVVRDNNGFGEMYRLEERTAAEAAGRRALAQLLVDGNAPREIIHLLATLIAPDGKPVKKGSKERLRGESLRKTGENQQDLSLTGSEWIVSIRLRDNKRRRDANLVGSIAQRVHEKRMDGMSLERAFTVVSKEAKAAGIKKMSRESVRAIWRTVSWVWE